MAKAILKSSKTKESFEVKAFQAKNDGAQRFPSTYIIHIIPQGASMMRTCNKRYPIVLWLGPLACRVKPFIKAGAFLRSLSNLICWVSEASCYTED
jgi:hypothetical protein